MKASATGNKKKLTLSIDKKIYGTAMDAIDRRSPKVVVSNMVQTYLTFLADAPAWCFSCGEQFTVSQADKCKKCNFMKCPDCKGCGCGLKEETVVAMRNMRKVYKHLGAEVDE
jgi:hypothetical protein